MKLPNNLYSRLTLITCAILITGYGLVYAFTTLVLTDADGGKPLTSTLMKTIMGNVNELNTNLTTIAGKFGTLTNGKWCTTDGTKIDCTTDAPMGGGSSLWNTGATNSINYTAGNVGIGTTVPWATLEVAGNIIASTPTAANHVATKAYVDAAVSGASGSPIKSIQRGSVASAWTVTITAVTTTKTMILSVSKGSAGTVAVAGTISMSVWDDPYGAYGNGNTGPATRAGTISWGTTNLVAKSYSCVLTNSTTLTCDGPAEYQVIEYN